MNRARALPSVLTLEEAARYLRLPKESIKTLTQQGILPGRQVGRTWRFLRAALDDWLRARNGQNAFLQQFGAFADDPALPELRKAIYAGRGRSEVAEGD